MNTQDTIVNNTPNLLYGTMLVVNLDYSGIANYTVQAFIGGLFWIAFKILGDTLSRKMKAKKDKKQEPKK